MINKGSLFFALLIGCSGHLFSQDKRYDVSLNKNELVLEVANIEEGGLLIKTGALSLFGKNVNTIHYISSSGQELWSKELKSEIAMLRSHNILVASPNGDVVYNIELNANMFYNEAQYLTQIKRDGEEKKFVLKVKEEYGKNLLNIFCDDQYLYYVTAEEGWEMHENKKTKEKLVINRFSHNDFSYTKIYPSMPTIEDGETTSFWIYGGQFEGEKYFYSKTIDIDKGAGSVQLVVLDNEGKVLRKSLIPITLAPGTCPRPSVDLSPVADLWNYHSFGYSRCNFDFIMTVPKGGMSFTPAGAIAGGFRVPPSMNTQRINYKYTSSAFIRVAIDGEHQALYIFGLYGHKPFRQVASRYEGFYIQKFDLNGGNQWSLVQPAPDELKKVAKFTIHAAPHQRNIALEFLPDSNVAFAVSVLSDAFTFSISSDGKLQKVTHAAKGESFYGSALNTELSPKAKTYVDQEFGKSKDIGQRVFLHSMGDDLLLFDKRKSKVSVLFFKR